MVNFRNGLEKDIAEIARLEKEAFSDAWSQQSIGDTLQQKQAFVAVAEEAERVIAYCIIYYVLDEAEIARIAVNQTLRRRGIGQGLLNYICQWCKEKQIQRLCLDVRQSNEVAKGFYAQYGFVVDGIRKGFYENPKEDAVLMSKAMFSTRSGRESTL